jgi:hypothetical protein
LARSAKSTGLNNNSNTKTTRTRWEVAYGPLSLKRAAKISEMNPSSEIVMATTCDLDVFHGEGGIHHRQDCKSRHVTLRISDLYSSDDYCTLIKDKVNHFAVDKGHRNKTHPMCQLSFTKKPYIT